MKTQKILLIFIIMIVDRKNTGHDENKPEQTRAIVAKMGGIVVASLGEVTFHQTWLVLGWVICVRWHITFVYDQPI